MKQGISLRIIDSQENLRRNDLINKINYDLENKLGLEKIVSNLQEF